MSRSGDIGREAENAVCGVLSRYWPNIERRRLKGIHDQGDITGTPGIVWEVKGGKAAERASDGQIEQWLEETEVERRNAGAEVGVLVVKRKGIGSPNADRWWAIIAGVELHNFNTHLSSFATVRMHLGEACQVLREWGY